MASSPFNLILCALIAATSACCVASASDFSLADVEKIAERMAKEPHTPPTKVGGPFLDLNYDTYRLIAQRHENALWRDLGLETWVEFFPAGFLFEYPVKVHVVEGDQVTEVEYGDRWFQFRGEAERLADAPGGGFAGLRLMSQLPGNEHKTEYLAFLGASYFRGIGSGQWYGSSARGLAVDIGLGKPEEFPRFLEFWIERPDTSKSDCPQRMWALLESPGVVGAYEFCIRPGEETKVGVTARIWQRHGIQKLALAPLTSMFMWNPATKPANDPRPSVHDADGLLIHRDDDEWVWRDLKRPVKPQVEAWQVQQLHGFGLMQRDRDPDNYQDNEAHYHLRPSVWVETGARDAWGPGTVELLELPAEHEGVDNIGAYYVIDQTKVDLSQSIEINYELSFGTSLPWGHQVAPVIDSQIRQANGTVSVEFQIPENLSGDDIVLSPVAKCSHGRITSIDYTPSGKSTVEVSIRYQADEAREARIEVWLEKQQKKVSEVFSHRWSPAVENLRLVNQ
ncbi:glucan biosynthesis protein [Aeoliella sp. ICT_H6.2]|uniref:Glucan biosynthesis protein n=1 Tax=Aeoliella straminimaris TaxID=2954799 RepID=A0A9X2F6Z5_9BACT|nr:glucan biosynthesis protein [Aeoliella straminimaris]MCO6043472.1 glucan biosynthesis protein [Aeoliella straminimaris]